MYASADVVPHTYADMAVARGLQGLQETVSGSQPFAAVCCWSFQSRGRHRIFKFVLPKAVTV